MIKVLIVDDSLVSRQLLKYIFHLTKDIAVIAEAKDGAEALRFIQDCGSSKPDLITMDIEMPGIDGYETTKRILEFHPIPVVIISNALHYFSAEKAFRSLQAGAVSAVGKPAGLGSPDFYRNASELADLIRKCASIDVKSHSQTIKSQIDLGQNSRVSSHLEEVLSSERIVTWCGEHHPEIVAIGASTGGPPAIQTILSRLPTDFNFPIVIVQHIASGLAGNFAEWLDATCSIRCKLAEEGEIIAPGTVYIAQNDVHTVVTREKKIGFQLPEPKELLVPSVEALFHSVVESFGQNTIGILLSGMGRDGSRSMKELRNAGALTIAQDKQSSVVYGMPGEAEKLQAACCFMPPESIAEMLLKVHKAYLKRKEKSQ